MRSNLFSTWYNTALTLFFGITGALALWFGLGWAFGEANWQVIPTMGGLIFIGQYNTEGACPGQDCFWEATSLFAVSDHVVGDELGGGRRWSPSSALPSWWRR